MVAELHRWSGGVKAMCLAASLRGDARAILADLEAEKRRNYTDLVDALSSRFGPTRQTELRRIQLRNRGRKKGETIPELAQDVKRLTRFAYPGASSHLQDQLARDHFVDCLEEPELRLGVHQTRPKTLEEAVQAALEIEAFYTVERQRNFPLRKAVRVLHSDQGMTNTLAPPMYHAETQLTNRVQTDTVSELREAVSQLATDIAALKPHLQPRRVITVSLTHGHQTLRSATDQGEESVNCPRLQEVKLCRSLEGPTAKAPEGATEEEPEEKPEGKLGEKPGEQPEEEPEEKPEEGEANNETTSSTPLENKPTWPGVWSVAKLRELQQRDEDTRIMEKSMKPSENPTSPKHRKIELKVKEGGQKEEAEDDVLSTRAPSPAPWSPVSNDEVKTVEEEVRRAEQDQGDHVQKSMNYHSYAIGVRLDNEAGNQDPATVQPDTLCCNTMNGKSTNEKQSQLTAVTVSRGSGQKSCHAVCHVDKDLRREARRERNLTTDHAVNPHQRNEGPRLPVKKTAAFPV
ncbi:hypothetical protein HOLleu_42118 [Holothuria leucospilota]|uniref:Uncharacterized protein n=1 Tax=Holothuria leucospilota TaxID=206669 RepID=A0A9Q1BBI0_HOLLE|nr:hypothetical protein HOLleu_42118 [Holothuria leucospilota]